MVHVYPFALQHQTGPAITKAPPICRDLAHEALSDLLICLLLLAPHRLRIAPIRRQTRACETSWRSSTFRAAARRSAGPQPFPNRSFSMELSSTWSTRSRFSLAFSFSVTDLPDKRGRFWGAGQSKACPNITTTSPSRSLILCHGSSTPMCFSIARAPISGMVAILPTTQAATIMCRCRISKHFVVLKHIINIGA